MHRRSRGHASSQHESMMDWHTARSLNMGSWMATCGVVVGWGVGVGRGREGECLRKGKKGGWRPRRARNQPTSLLSRTPPPPQCRPAAPTHRHSMVSACVWAGSGEQRRANRHPCGVVEGGGAPKRVRVRLRARAQGASLASCVLRIAAACESTKPPPSPRPMRCSSHVRCRGQAGRRVAQVAVRTVPRASRPTGQSNTAYGNTFERSLPSPHHTPPPSPHSPWGTPASSWTGRAVAWQ